MENQELRKMIEETMELSKDNNRILHSIQRRDRMALVMRVVYWMFIIGITAGAFYYIQPYIDKLMQAYTGMVDTQQKVVEVSSKFNFDTLKSHFN